MDHLGESLEIIETWWYDLLYVDYLATGGLAEQNDPRVACTTNWLVVVQRVHV